MNNKVLLIDDDRKLGDTLGEYLSQNQLVFSHSLHPIEGIEIAKETSPDLILLDVMLPEIDGFEACRRLKHETDIPIIMLTARGEAIDRIVGLEIGADDYLSKPFEPRELLIRVQNILKRQVAEGTKSEKQDKHILKFKGLSIDSNLRRVMLNDVHLELTTTEYQLLDLFLCNPLKNFTRDEILNELKGIDVELFSRSVDITISRLRKKLAPLDYIKTVWGSGYSFVPEYDGDPN